MRAAGLEVERSFFAFRSDDQVLCWRMVQAGFGIGFNQVAIGARNPALVRRWPEADLGALPVWLTANHDLRMRPRLRICLEHLAEGFAAL